MLLGLPKTPSTERLMKDGLIKGTETFSRLEVILANKAKKMLSKIFPGCFMYGVAIKKVNLD